MSAKFKVGDKVRCLDEGGWCGNDGPKVGEVYTVAKVTEPTWTMERFIHLAEFSEKYPEHNRMESRYELVKPQPKFKAGDIVRTDDTVIRDWCIALGGNPDRMTVRSLDNRGYPIMEWEAATAQWGFDPDQIELVVEPPKAQPKFKVGGRVRNVSDNGWSSKTNPVPTVAIGKEYTVGKVVEYSGRCYVAFSELLEEFPGHLRRAFYYELVQDTPVYIGGVGRFESMELAREHLQRNGAANKEYKVFDMVPRGSVTVEQTVTRTVKEVA